MFHHRKHWGMDSKSSGKAWQTSGSCGGHNSWLRYLRESKKGRGIAFSSYQHGSEQNVRLSSAYPLDGVLLPMAILLIELPLPLVHLADIAVCIMEDIERSNNAIIRSWLTVSGYALPDQKNLFSKALYIITVFHHRDPFDVTQLRGLSGSCSSDL